MQQNSKQNCILQHQIQNFPKLYSDSILRKLPYMPLFEYLTT